MEICNLKEYYEDRNDNSSIIGGRGGVPGYGTNQDEKINIGVVFSNTEGKLLLQTEKEGGSITTSQRVVNSFRGNALDAKVLISKSVKDVFDNGLSEDDMEIECKDDITDEEKTKILFGLDTFGSIIQDRRGDHNGGVFERPRDNVN